MHSTRLVKVNFFHQLFSNHLIAQNHQFLSRVHNATTEDDREFLKIISKEYKLTTTLLPIKSVGVQVGKGNTFDEFKKIILMRLFL